MRRCEGGAFSSSLVPTSGTTFDLKGLSGYSLEFKKDELGAVVEFVVYQPTGTLVATLK